MRSIKRYSSSDGCFAVSHRKGIERLNAEGATIGCDFAGETRLCTAKDATDSRDRRRRRGRSWGQHTCQRDPRSRSYLALRPICRGVLTWPSQASCKATTGKVSAPSPVRLHLRLEAYDQGLICPV